MTMGREVLIARGLPLVQRIARAMVRRLPHWVDVADLIGAGYEGLVAACATYDPAVGEWEPYAGWRIRGAMLDEMRALDCLTRYARSWLNRREETLRRLRQELGREPSDVEVAERLGIPLGDYQRTLAQVDWSRGHNAVDEIEDGTGSVEERLVQDELHAQLRAAVARLSPRRQRALELYYEHEHTQLEIARELGVTESRVCQILSEAEAALRTVLAPDAPRRRSQRGTNRAYNNLRAEAAE